MNAPYRCPFCRSPFHAISGAVYCCGWKPSCKAAATRCKPRIAAKASTPNGK